MFSELKWLLRSATLRTVDALWHFLGQALNHFPPQECLHDFRHCRYAKPSWDRE